MVEAAPYDVVHSKAHDFVRQRQDHAHWKQTEEQLLEAKVKGRWRPGIAALRVGTGHLPVAEGGQAGGEPEGQNQQVQQQDRARVNDEVSDDALLNPALETVVGVPSVEVVLASVAAVGRLVEDAMPADRAREAAAQEAEQIVGEVRAVQRP